MNENTLILMVGLPRSGKSTKARKLGHPIVNPDAIRLSLHGHAYIPLAEPYVWAIAGTMALALFAAGHETVTIDATNNTAARRAEWVKLARGVEGCAVAVIEMRTPFEVCCERAGDDGNMANVIERMHAAHEPVDYEAEEITTDFVDFST